MHLNRSQAPAHSRRCHVPGTVLVAAAWLLCLFLYVSPFSHDVTSLSLFNSMSQEYLGSFQIHFFFSHPIPLLLLLVFDGGSGNFREWGSPWRCVWPLSLPYSLSFLPARGGRAFSVHIPDTKQPGPKPLTL